MTALEVLGVVEIRAGQGIFVGQAQSNHLIEAVSSLTDEQGPLEILEARLLIEPGAAEFAAKRATPSDLQLLRSQLDLMKEQLDKGMDARKPDWGFHQVITKAAQNPVMEAMLEVITQRSERELWTRMRKHNFEQRARAFRYLEDHRQILAAIESRDGELASRLMLTHIKSIQADLGVEADGGTQAWGGSRTPIKH
jgi:GntR family uxuAB operon transcriptional repressor